ncbi:lipoxygenase family protein [Acanthopleuribacter pedis]|uniref:Lipoxygenase domain-containing protein n=1 Tax=Acanthopleuribacter pedis TaxID=442870 RepID=A0A8J7U5S2_9BACT|nr:lipoxygenase family protein [Acanthopleuribacter pedis]MBO1320758.1 hypothetical protein [Acanthopleuribacter pedis]
MYTVSLSSPQDPPSLPQKETPENQEKRKQALVEAQAEYVLSADNPHKIPLLQLPIPSQEAFSNHYNAERYMATLPMVNNEAVVSPGLQPFPASFTGLWDFDQLYKEIPKPLVHGGWMTDELFGEQRLSGVNPGVLRGVKSFSELPACLKGPLTERLADPVSALIQAGGLYMVDYTETLKDIPNGALGPVPKFLPRPIGVFGWYGEGAKRKDPGGKNGRLLPVAILVDISDSDYKLFTPEDGERWTLAKMCFNIADANVHEMSSHLGIAHFAQEAFGAITPRHLAANHPLRILLAPHLRFLVFNNEEGIQRLINKGGPVDKLLASTLAGSIEIARTAAANWSVMESFSENLAARGVNDDKALPHYPFRDDGLLIWKAISTFVENYLGLYYLTDDDVAGDYELQAWAQQLASSDLDGGRVKDMPSPISRADLFKVVANIIFTCSAGHSSVNYPQNPYLGFAPSAALSGWQDYRAFLANEHTTEAEQLDFMLKFLPPQQISLAQIGITYALSAYHFDQLGDYGDQFSDPMARHQLYRFNQDLNTIEQKIEVRNQSRVVPYTFLLPKEILNSPSI